MNNSPAPRRDFYVIIENSAISHNMAAKMRLFLLLPILLVYAQVHAGSLGDVIRGIDEASAKIHNFCTYTVKYKKDSKVGPEKVMSKYSGNAFFIEHSGAAHLALTNKHILECATEKEDIRDYLPEGNINAVESFLAVSSLKMQRGTQFFNAVIADMPINKAGDIDLAILEIEWPQGASTHHHSLILSDEDAYDLGDEVIVRGFMPCGSDIFCDEDGWVRRLKFARIEGLTRDKVFMQLNTAGYSGMSGSPVVILKDGKPRVIGIFAVAFYTNQYGSVDMSWAVRLKKEYFDTPKKP